MKIITTGSQPVAFTVNNGRSTFTESTCPPGIRPTVEKAIRRGKETKGTVVGGGLLWHWRAGHWSEDSVRLQLQGEREEYFGAVEIPKSKWEAFSRLAKQRGMSGVDFLCHTLAAFVRINADLGYEEAVALLFGEHHEERTYFVGPSDDHEVSAPAFDGRAG